MNRKLKTTFAAAILVLGLSACSKEELVEVGILQYATHGALDSARLGFIAALEEEGFIDGENIRITVKNPQGEQSLITTMTTSLVRSSDLIFAIATPAAMAIKNELAAQNSQIPALFTAVTDPVDSNLVVSTAAPGGTMTGTHDMNPVALQIGLAKQILPNITKIGLLYNSSEVNSQTQATLAIEAATALGISTVTQTVTTANEIQQAITALAIAGVEAIYAPTDNLLATSMNVVASKAVEYDLPVICGESSMAEAGGTITLGIDYYELGFLTGKMAAEILSGTKTPEEIPVEGLTSFDLILNKQNADSIGLTFSNALLEAADRIIE